MKSLLAMTSVFGILLLLPAAVLLSGGCASHRAQVRQYGRMHDVLSGGAAKATGQVQLAAVLDRPHAYGVGALAGLEGEITVYDGKVWLARVKDGALHVDEPTAHPAESAALLTVAYVEAWSEVVIDRALAGEELEAFIAAQARRAGVDTRSPFPFLILGDTTDLQLHVIHGECPMRPGVRLTEETQPWRRTREQPTPAKVVGVYAADSVGDLTHPGTAIHAHVLFEEEDATVTGHVERLAVAEGAVLKLPAGR